MSDTHRRAVECADATGGTPAAFGRIVYYESDGRGGLRYPLAAVISGTADNHAGDYPDGSPNPLPVPDPERGEVHLFVMSPGEPYTEHSVPYDEAGAPRTWRWPERA